jgi:Bacteriophage clamp loader A subunit
VRLKLKQKKTKSKEVNEVKEDVVKELNPFDFIKSIQQTKVNLIRESDDPLKTEKLYNPWLTNKALSFHIDSVLYANEMNRSAGLDNLMQYEYYINTIRNMKRNHIWLKKSTDNDIEFLCEVFKLNKKRALEILNIIGSKKLEEIKMKITKGGIISKK